MNHLNADAIATGHYARTSFGPYLEHYQPDTRNYQLICVSLQIISFFLATKLLQAYDSSKDQTLFLAQVTERVLRKTMFPLCDIAKAEVKRIAADNGLKKFALKKESTGICFIGTRKFQEFIAEVINRSFVFSGFYHYVCDST